MRTKYGRFTPINFAVFLDGLLLLRKIRIRNPIQGGKSIDLHDGMHFVADLISNCFFEVNNVNILCFLGFQSSVECKRYQMVYNDLFLALTLACSLMIAVGFILSGEFNGKCWFCSLRPILYIFVFVLMSRVKASDFNRSGWGESSRSLSLAPGSINFAVSLDR